MYTTTVGEPVDMVSAGVVELMVTVKKRVPSVTKFAVVLMLQTLLVDPASSGRTNGSSVRKECEVMQLAGDAGSSLTTKYLAILCVCLSLCMICM